MKPSFSSAMSPPMLTSPHHAFLRDVLHGLSQKQKTLPYKYFYDEVGSQLFERICETPEYYVTRTETALLQEVSAEVAAACGEGVEVVEFGSGAGEKIRLLLRALSRPVSYTPIDISSEILMESAARLREEFPSLVVWPILLDYTEEAAWAKIPAAERVRRIVFFPGSTLGNFAPEEAEAFLRRLHEVAGRSGALLIGIDLQKEAAVLEAAYNDAEGVTAAFNLHLLERIRDELGVVLRVEDFSHRAVVNEVLGRVEMHLVCHREQAWDVASSTIHFAEGETIHTENSYKFTLDGFCSLARRAGWRPSRVWTDPRHYFSLHLLEAATHESH